MNRLKTSLQAAAGVFAIIPGLAVLATNIGVPPNCSKVMFFATIESFGIFTLMLLHFNQNMFKSFSIKAINSLTIGSILVFAFTMFLYLYLFSEYVVEVAGSSPLFFPLWPRGELKQGLADIGSKANLIKEWGRDDVFHVIKSSSSSMLTRTTLFFLFLYQLIFVSLTFAFGLLALRVGEMKDNSLN
ncbi:hypothetical protein SNE25_13865 [Mucilaginibacter sabulilitoris]|uniref:DUF4199 domain-containing protein n=1 Tax=Mucilaginibacter sabulilitoris TaxID=1173583 RepID=A0ABZ0TYN1_9SPHI|nr:hypothetical protein [Mucilaginibacter sabulilitoris]WPU96605.1 hypothetical protein SNE25_13865 [Mucilaginibacter sabulilitoris]